MSIAKVVQSCLVRVAVDQNLRNLERLAKQGDLAAKEALKRALKTGVLKIESAAEQMSLASTVSLEPDPIPLSVKVDVTGTNDTVVSPTIGCTPVSR